MQARQETFLNVHGQEYRECILYPLPKNGKRDVRKNWMIRFYVTHLETNELKKVDLKKYNHIKAHKERLNKVNTLMADINNKLHLGYVFDSEIGMKNKLAKMSIRDDFKSYLDYQKNVKKLSKETIRIYTSVFKHVDNFLIENKIERMQTQHFDKSHAKSYYNELLVSEMANGSKARLYLTVFRLFIEWYYDENNIEKTNPFARYKITVKESDKHTPYTGEERKLIWDYLRDKNDFQLLLMTKLIYFTFGRPHKELRMLKIGDIKGDRLRIGSDNNKSNHSKEPILPEELTDLIEELGINNYPKNFYIFGTGGVPGVKVVNQHFFYQSFKLLKDKLGFDDNYTIYGFKHSGNISLYEITNGNLAMLQNQNGHKSANSTAKYIRKYAHSFNQEDLKGWS